MWVACVLDNYYLFLVKYTFLDYCYTWLSDGMKFNNDRYGTLCNFKYH